MRWTEEAKREAAVRAPAGPGLLRPDTQIIERPGWYQVLTPSTRSSVLNEVVLSSVPEDDAERVIDEVIAGYEAHGLPTKWCVGPWTWPRDFGERLAKRGFEITEIRGMARDATAPLASPDDVRVVDAGEDELADFVSTFARGWDDYITDPASELEYHRAALRADPRVTHLFTAYAEDVPIGTAGLLLRDGYGYLIGGQVLEEHRGRGGYRALIAARLAFLAERGMTLAVTHAREATSAPRLEHLGFEAVFRSRCYILGARGRSHG